MTAKTGFFLVLLGFFGCRNGDTTDVVPEDGPEATTGQDNNLLATMRTENLMDFRWMNKPESFEVVDRSLQVVAPENSDFFNDPATGKHTASAPLLYKEVSGDFVITTRVQPDFSSVWNAANLMVYRDSSTWAKLAFEHSDATGPSIVMVVTKEVSDDANGPILNEESSIWLRLIRKGDLYAMHWSKNGRDFKMARLFALPTQGAVKVGIAAQCPAGEAARHSFLYLSIDHRTVGDLRKGE